MNAEERALTKAIAASKAAITRHKANLKFARLPAAQKRVAVAKDVLAMIALPTQQQPSFESTYITVRDGDATQEQLCTDPSACRVCGVGALMLAHFRLFNDVPNKWDLNDMAFEDIAERLHGYFSEHQLALIEAAFEGRTGINLDAINSDEVMGWSRYTHATNRTACLREIMRNLVRNKGTFKIKQVPIPQ